MKTFSKKKSPLISLLSLNLKWKAVYEESITKGLGDGEEKGQRINDTLLSVNCQLRPENETSLLAYKFQIHDHGSNHWYYKQSRRHASFLSLFLLLGCKQLLLTNFVSWLTGDKLVLCNWFLVIKIQVIRKLI